MVTRFCPFLYIFRPYTGLRRFTGGLMRFMQKLLVFPDQIDQGLSNAPTLKCFGPKVADIYQIEVLSDMRISDKIRERKKVLL